MILKVKIERAFVISVIFVLVTCINFDAIAKTDTLIVIRTSLGTIKLKLYDDTPNHRHNFIKLVQSGFYDSLLFHRVINSFMIQGGDPDSKTAVSIQTLGNGDVDYTIPDEVNPNHFHKKGALAAARQADDINPKRVSSGCQFYIVHGKKYAEMDMATVESRMANQLKQSLTLEYLRRPENKELQERFESFQQARNTDSLTALKKIIQPFVEAELSNHKIHKFTPEEKMVYAKVGGSPHLDGNYTVFGEVIGGIEIVDKIAEVEVSGNNRPKLDIRMKVTLEVVNN